VGQGDGVDQGIGKGELVFDEEVRCSDGDFLADGDDDAGTHRLGDDICLLAGALLEDDLAHLGEDDGRDEQVGKFEQNRAKMDRVGSIIKTLDPSAGIQNSGVHVGSAT